MLRKIASSCLAIILVSSLSISSFASDSVANSISYEDASNEIEEFVFELNQKYDQNFNITLHDLGRNYKAQELQKVKNDLFTIAEGDRKTTKEIQDINDWTYARKRSDIRPFGDLNVLVDKTRTYNKDTGSGYMVHINCSATFEIEVDDNSKKDLYIAEVTDISTKGKNSQDTWTAKESPRVSYGASRKSVTIAQKGSCYHYSPLWEGTYKFTATWKFPWSDFSN